MSLVEKIKHAAATRTPLRIRAGGTKDGYGRAVDGEVLDVSAEAGIVEYDPAELVLTARTATPLSAIETVLAQNRQMLAFEPPHFGAGATLGGTLACGFAGPARPYCGSARDSVLGVQLIDGTGEVLNFGGKVMKNVAGYDVSRLMVGALGTLGVLTQASVKVVPRPQAELTLQFELDEAAAITRMNQLAGLPLPLSAATWAGGLMLVRLSGVETAVHAAHAQLGGEVNVRGADYWLQAREHRSAFYADQLPLWRLSVPPAAPPLNLPGKTKIGWGGAQRWLKSDAPMELIRAAAVKAGGHATLFAGGDRIAEVFQPLPPVLLNLHRRLKQQFDPYGILNPGRMYSAL